MSLKNIIEIANAASLDQKLIAIKNPVQKIYTGFFIAIFNWKMNWLVYLLIFEYLHNSWFAVVVELDLPLDRK